MCVQKVKGKKPNEPWEGEDIVVIKIIVCQAAEGSLLLPSLVGIRFGKELE